MIKGYNFNSNLNKFFSQIILKKQYIKKLAHIIIELKHVKEQNYKNLGDYLFVENKYLTKPNNLIRYIINISFSRSNTLLHITDFSGLLKFCCSAGNLFYSGKNKTARVSIFKSMLRIINQKLKILQNKPIALHLKNVGFKKF